MSSKLETQVVPPSSFIEQMLAGIYLEGFYRRRHPSSLLAADPKKEIWFLLDPALRKNSLLTDPGPQGSYYSDFIFLLISSRAFLLSSASMSGNALSHPTTQPYQLSSNHRYGFELHPSFPRSLFQGGHRQPESRCDVLEKSQGVQ